VVSDEQRESSKNSGMAPNDSTRLSVGWEHVLRERIGLYGHRNWIVIADSAYPALSRQGVETIVADAAQIDVLQRALNALSDSRHLKPVVYADVELSFVDDDDAPGIEIYRQRLSRLLGGYETKTLRHEEIITKLDHASETFRVLIIKTNLTLPYTSVFLELDCSYWKAESEAKLRARILHH